MSAILRQVLWIINPGTVSAIGQGALWQTRTAIAASTAGNLYPGEVRFPVNMHTTPTVTLYSPDTGTASAIRNVSTGE